MTRFSVTLKVFSLLLRNPALIWGLMSGRSIVSFLRILLAPNFDAVITLRQVELLAANPHLKDGSVNLEAPAVVIFPVIDWSFRYQRPHHIAVGLAKVGFRVIYISPVSPRSNGRQKFRVCEKPSPNLCVVSLKTSKLTVRNLHSDLMTPREISDVKFAYDQLSKVFKLEAAAIICQHPYWAPLISKLDYGKLLYDRLDDHGAFPGVSGDLLALQEKFMFDIVDGVIATSSRLFESIPSGVKKALIRNACSPAKFNDAEKTKVNSVIYVGAIEPWFDAGLIDDIAIQRPEITFHFVGSVSDQDAKALQRHTNCVFYGELSYVDAMAKVARSSVGIIPFHINGLTLATNPVKFYEYLSFGLPVVATHLPELEGLEGIDVYTVGSPREFLAALDQAMVRAACPIQKAKRIAWAGENTWEKRVEEIQLFLPQLN